MKILFRKKVGVEPKKESPKPVKKKLKSKPEPKPIKKDVSTLQKENDRLRKLVSVIMWGDVIIGIIIMAILFLFGGV